MKNIAIIDFEWTSWSGNYHGKYLEKEKRSNWQKKEIIQMGIVLIDRKYNLIKKYNIYVKPIFNSQLSDYIINLTGISQTKIDKLGIEFPIALNYFLKFTKNCILISNGTDGDVLNDNLFMHKIKNKTVKIINIKNILFKKYNVPKEYLHSTVIHNFYGYKIYDHKAHDAISDCLNIQKALRKMSFNFDDLKY